MKVGLTNKNYNLIIGNCTVNESDISGENNLVMKIALKNNNNIFKYSNNPSSIVYHGTKVNKCESLSQNGKCYALAINTGLNTNRGNLIQNILFPKPTNFKIMPKIIPVFLGMIISFTIYEIYFFGVFVERKEEKNVSTGELASQIIMELCNEYVSFFTPTFVIVIVFTSFYFQYKLNQSDISCTSALRLNAASKVNIVVLDKTGTLTEEGYDLYGYQTSKINYDETNPTKVDYFDVIESSSSLYNKIYIDFWNRLITDKESEIRDDYKTNFQVNLIYYMECLATCHSIEKIKEEILGNSIDRRIFEEINWIFEKSKSENNEEVTYFNYRSKYTYEIRPQNTDKIYSNIDFNIKNHENRKNRFYIQILKRFEFNSKFQSMSVIIRNNFDKSFRYFIKELLKKLFKYAMKTQFLIYLMKLYYLIRKMAYVSLHVQQNYSLIWKKKSMKWIIEAFMRIT